MFTCELDRGEETHYYCFVVVDASIGKILLEGYFQALNEQRLETEKGRNDHRIAKNILFTLLWGEIVEKHI